MLLGDEGQHIEDDDEWVGGWESRPGFPERSVTAARLPQALCFTFTLYSWCGHDDSHDDSDHHALAHNDDDGDNNDRGESKLANAGVSFTDLRSKLPK